MDCRRPSHTAWFLDPSDLVGFFEPTPVSKQLDELLDRFPCRRVQAPDLSFVDGPLRKFVLPVMYPKRRLLPPYWAVNGRWRMDPDGVARQVKMPDSAPYAAELHKLLVTEAEDMVARRKRGFTPTAVIFGRNAVTDRWL